MSMKWALCEVTFPLSWSMSASFYLLPLILESRDYHNRSSGSIYLSYPMKTVFHGNHPNLPNYRKDGNFVLEDDSVILFCFVSLRGLIVLGSSSTNPSNQRALAMQAMRSHWERFPVIVMVPTSFPTLTNAMTMFWQWHYLYLWAPVFQKPGLLSQSLKLLGRIRS